MADAVIEAGNPRRETARPTAEHLLEAFRDITLTIIEGLQQTARHVTALSPLQQRIRRFWAFRQRCIQGFAPFLLNRLKNERTVRGRLSAYRLCCIDSGRRSAFWIRNGNERSADGGR